MPIRSGEVAAGHWGCCSPDQHDARINEHREAGSRPTAGAAAGLGDAEQQELLSKSVNGSTTLDLQCLISTLRDLT